MLAFACDRRWLQWVSFFRDTLLHRRYPDGFGPDLCAFLVRNMMSQVLQNRR